MEINWKMVGLGFAAGVAGLITAKSLFSGEKKPPTVHRKPKIIGLAVHPIKGCRAMKVKSWKVDKFGLEYDRRWMIVKDDDEHSFVTQRQISAITSIIPIVDLEKGVLNLSAPSKSSETFSLSLPPIVNDETYPAYKNEEELISNASKDSSLIMTKIHGRPAFGYDEGDEVASWLSTTLGCPLRLLRKAEKVPRYMAAPYEGQGESSQVAFPDQMPILIASTAGLRDLNERLYSKGEKPVPMDRFRANIILDESSTSEDPLPYIEDWMEAIEIPSSSGGPAVKLIATNPCRRCVVTTTDQETGERNARFEPVKTLRSYRADDWGGKFGFYYAPAPTTGRGPISVGDPIVIKEHRASAYQFVSLTWSKDVSLAEQIQSKK